MERLADERILVLMPTMKDNERIARMFASSGLGFYACADMADLCGQMEHGAAVALVTEEAILADGRGCLSNALANQPPWSDFPLIVLAREQGGADRLRESMNVTLVERPVRMRSLLSVLRAALRSRRHQYEIRDHLARQQRSEEALRQADRRKDEFLATLAHELRNPLAPLRNSINLLQMTASDDQRIAPVCEIMERQVNHLVRLVDDLMEVSRITRGRIDLRWDTVELAAVLRSALETSRLLLDDAGVQLALSLPQQPVVLHGDFVRLSQIFGNLLNNAAKYTDAGGQVWFTARCEGDEVVVSVRDTGIGIAQDALPKVFDMFMQADRATTRSKGGLGIGLTLVRSLVELHGGSITARSEGPDRGSEFIVRLPLAKTCDDSNNSGAPRNARHVIPSRRIVVVDDNTDSATTLGSLLKLLGADVHIAHDGPTALVAIERLQPDVVLLDIGMPEMDGYEVARRIRGNSLCSHIQLIALTGWGQEDDRRRTREAGFDYHFVKPVDINALQSFLGPRE